MNPTPQVVLSSHDYRTLSDILGEPLPGVMVSPPVPASVSMDDIVAAYEKMPPPPEPIKLTQAQWDEVRAKTPEYRGVSPLSAAFLGTPVEIVDDPAESSVHW